MREGILYVGGNIIMWEGILYEGGNIIMKGNIIMREESYYNE